jgi:hypothetical protein
MRRIVRSEAFSVRGETIAGARSEAVAVLCETFAILSEAIAGVFQPRRDHGDHRGIWRRNG